MSQLRHGSGEVLGAVADLGVLVPLAAALILVNGLEPGPVFLAAGGLVLVSGLVFRIPFPVQPLKALTAVAVAERLSPDVIHAAGVEIGVLLLLLSVGGVADRIARVFTKPVVRALQHGVGVLLIVSALRLVGDPPPVFRATLPSAWPAVLAAAAFAVMVWTTRGGRYGICIAVLTAGVISAWAAAGPDLRTPSLTLPSASVPSASALVTAFFLLVVPQIPLTFGNAVVAVSDLAHEYLGDAARRVTAARVCLSSGLANIASALTGGMPMCHGAGGLTAHVQLGARTAGMNVLLGSTLAVLGAFFASDILVILGLLPTWGLAAFLGYAGLRHAVLVRDLHGGALTMAIGTGLAGALLGNLAVTAAAALLIEQARRVMARPGASPTAPALRGLGQRKRRLPPPRGGRQLHPFNPLHPPETSPAWGDDPGGESVPGAERVSADPGRQE
jgi:SulP family sulfate permease